MSNEVEITIVVPVYNEEQAISKVLDGIERVMDKSGKKYEIVVVDDGSEDKTPEIVKQKSKIKLIQHSYNRGYGNAIKTGIKNAYGERILIIDGDGTYDPSEIPKLMEHMSEYHMVVGARVGRGTKIPMARKPGKWFLSILANYLSGVKIPDINSGFRILRKEDVNSFWNILPPQFSFTTTITLACLSSDYSIKFVPVTYHARKGESKIRLFQDGFNFVLLTVRTITYFKPLKIFLPVGVIVLFLGTLSLLNDIVHQNITQLSIILLLGGTQICFFGLLADMIVKQRILR